MRVELHPIDYASTEHCELIAQWMLDSDFRARMTSNDEAGKAESILTASELAIKADRPAINRFAREFFIIVDERKAGIAGIEINPEHRSVRTGMVAWLDLGVACVQDRRCGIGSKALRKLEELSIEVGAQTLEVGVFAFNEPALKFFMQRGFKETARFPNGTWRFDKWWDDVRLTKPLTALHADK